MVLPETKSETWFKGREKRPGDEVAISDLAIIVKHAHIGLKFAVKK